MIMRAHPANAIYLMRQLLRLISAHRKTFASACIFLALATAINLLLPEILRRYLTRESISTLQSSLPASLIILSVLLLMQGGAFFMRSYLFGLIGQRVYTDLRRAIFSSIISREIEFFDRNRSGDLAARINSDAALVQDAVSTKLSVIIRYSVQALLGVVLMLFMSWRLTVAIVLAVLLLVCVSLLFVRNLRGAARGYQDRLSSYVAYVAEVFGGIRVVRNLAASEQVLERANLLNSAVSRSGERRITWGAAFSSGASALLNVLLLLVAGYGATLVCAGDLTIDQFIAFILYGAIVAVSFSFLIGAYGDLVQGLGGLERVLSLIGDAVNSQSSVERANSDRTINFKSDKGLELEFSGVTFSYPLSPNDLVLDEISFKIASGEFVGFVGPSGCGKSTLAQLLLGLYRPQKGVISLGGIALSEVAAFEISKLVTWVPQEPTLFDCSVIDNLLLGSPNLLRDEVLKLALSWGFLDFVEQLEFKFDTVLGERGASLSGGQRQRLAIARALLRQPKVLILDEATAGLDSELEERVFKVIRGYLPDATVVVISHRLASVSGASRIFVIDGGRVAQSGTHSELLADGGGIYQRYCHRQGLGGYGSI